MPVLAAGAAAIVQFGRHILALELEDGEVRWLEGAGSNLNSDTFSISCLFFHQGVFGTPFFSFPFWSPPFPFVSFFLFPFSFHSFFFPFIPSLCFLFLSRILYGAPQPLIRLLSAGCGFLHPPSPVNKVIVSL